MSIGARLLTAGILFALQACAAPSPVELGAESDVGTARLLLEEASRAGPVRLEINALPRTADGALSREVVERQAARGVRGIDLQFGAPPEATGSARLLLLFNPDRELRPTAVCNEEHLPGREPAAGTRLHAVFCNGGQFVADANAATSGSTAAEVERLIWRTTGRLFPDDYQDKYGFNLFGYRIGLGGQFGW